MKVSCLNPISKLGLGLFDDKYEVGAEYAESELVLVRSAAMHDLELPACQLAVARAGAGVNNIPLDKCAEQGIVVFNTPGANANGVKELVLAGMLLAARDVVGGIEWVKANKEDPEVGKAAEKAKKKFAGTEILGKKLGIIGLGGIGIKVANAGAALGMEVYGYTRHLTDEKKAKLSAEVNCVSDPMEIYANCDYISLHLPLSDATKGMINADVFSKMKDGAILLNFSRDKLVDDAALAEALSSGKVGKYVSDFPNAAVANMDGAIVIPHLGASTEESEDNCAKMAVEQLRDYVENGNIRNSVNYPAVSLGEKGSCQRVSILGKGLDVDAVLSKLDVANSTSAVKGDYCCILADVNKVCDVCLGEVKALPGVLRVRVI
ncbi:MAG: 3-phosphoglycerate dehydrogenase [Clostridiales bacterium]|nr:3-phosphoglycerate dehydrogenase [Clostridiales bacterium]MDY4180957.1 3-phosphoglycerate dehydrogenase [Pseudoflavonifractor sp.]